MGSEKSLAARCQHQLTAEADKCRHGFAWGTTCEHCIRGCALCWDSYSSSAAFGPAPETDRKE